MADASVDFFDSARRIGRMERDSPEIRDLLLDRHRAMVETYLGSHAESPEQRERTFFRALGDVLHPKVVSLASLAYVERFRHGVAELDPVLAQLAMLVEQKPRPEDLLQCVQELLIQGRLPSAAEVLNAMYLRGWLETTEASILQIVALMDKAGRTNLARDLLRAEHSKMPESIALADALRQLDPAAELTKGELAQPHASRSGISYEAARLDDARVAQAVVEGILYSPHHGFPGHYRKRHLEAYFEGPMPDRSFFLHLDAHPALFCELIGGKVDGVWECVPTYLSGTLNSGQRRKLLTTALDISESLTRQSNGEGLMVRVADEGNPGKETAHPLLALGYQPYLFPESIVDLGLAEAELWRQLRKSYKSLISRARKRSQILRFNRETPSVDVAGGRIDREAAIDFLGYLNLMSRGKRHPRACFGIYWDWMMERGGEISIDWHPDHGPVAATIAIDYCGESYYCWSRSIGPMLDALTPSAHGVLWETILAAKQRGNHVFVLGEMDNHAHDEPKKIEISHFKLGFATSVRPRLRWEKQF